ncbi:hypothetical protein SprV_0100017700 [Sparganum proliferum]
MSARASSGIAEASQGGFKTRQEVCRRCIGVIEFKPIGQQAYLGGVYVGHTGRRLGTRINEHKLAIRRRDPLSLVFAHAIECDHRFNWEGTEVIASANTKQAREFLEAWHSNDNSINRHVDLDAHYEDIFETVLQRINATTTDARRKKRDELNEKLQSLLCATDKCTISARVVNLSKRSLTPAEISLLSKGLKFNHTDAAPTNFLASLESVLLASAIPEDARADIRSCASGLLRQRKRHRNLTVDEEKGLRSLKTDDSIVVVPADKGGATVIMDKVDYVQKANTVFNDKEAYAPLAEDPTKKQAAAIKKKVNELARLKLINPNDSKFMTLSDPRIAHAYGLPKVHKPDAPLRIIVPLIGSPTYSLAKWLYRHLKHLADGSQYSIKNSQAFFEKIQGLKVSPDESILSFDVVALFSSIPHDLAIESVARRLRDNPIDIPTHHVLDMLKLCLNNYCQFDGKYYQQVKDTPMGSPISGLLAELVLQRLEQEVVQSFQPKKWLRYVDDTFVIVKTCEVEQFHQSLNGAFPALKFTREEAKEAPSRS